MPTSACTTSPSSKPAPFLIARDPGTTTVALGWFDPKRMDADYELVKTYFGLDRPFDVKEVYTDDFLDKSIKMTRE